MLAKPGLYQAVFVHTLSWTKRQNPGSLVPIQSCFPGPDAMAMSAAPCSNRWLGTHTCPKAGAGAAVSGPHTLWRGRKVRVNLISSEQTGRLTSRMPTRVRLVILQLMWTQCSCPCTWFLVGSCASQGRGVHSREA